MKEYLNRNPKIALIIYSLLFGGGAIFCHVRSLQVSSLYLDSEITSFKIIRLSCKSTNTSSLVVVKLEGREYYKSITKSLCERLTVGESLEYYYNKENDVLTEEGEDFKFKILSYFFLAMLIVGIFPWSKLKRLIVSRFNRS